MSAYYVNLADIPTDLLRDLDDGEGWAQTLLKKLHRSTDLSLWRGIFG